MNCREWEERIALYAGGDAEPGEAAEVERHVAGCAGCQVLASGLKDALERLREAHGEIPAEAHFAAVRARVLAEVERGRRPFWRRAWVHALAGAACLAVLLAVRVERAPMLPPLEAPHPPAAAAARRELPAVAPEAARAAVPVRRARPRRAGAVRPTAAAREPLLVHLVSDDPDVIIYWYTETRGE